MAFVATLSTSEKRAFSLGGPLKCEVVTYSAASGDTSGTITSSNLHSIQHCIIDGLQLSSAPSFSGNVVTLGFADPLATCYGTALLIGK